jgi:hypothetical protein
MMLSEEAAAAYAFKIEYLYNSKVNPNFGKPRDTKEEGA